MKFHTSYEFTPKLQEDSAKQYYWRMLRPRVGFLLGGLTLLGFALLYDSSKMGWGAGFLSAVVLLLIVLWVKACFQFLAQARAGLNLMENPRVEISMDDTLIEYASSTGSRRHHWNKIERIEETKDFVILMHGKLPLLSLPKACFSNEALAFIKDRVASDASE